MRLRTLFVPGLALAAAACLFAAAAAQQSVNFDLRFSTFAAGGGRSGSANTAIEDVIGGTVTGVAAGASAAVDSRLILSAGGDAHEVDDVCGAAGLITAGASAQTHTFHIAGDEDWVKFLAAANRTYLIDVSWPAESTAKPLLALHSACDQGPSTFGDSTLGEGVRLAWNAAHNDYYYLRLWPYDGAGLGAVTDYAVSVKVDTVPPAVPQNARCASLNASTVAVQWERSPDTDVVKYQVRYGDTANPNALTQDVPGRDTSYVRLEGLDAGQTYHFRVFALDFSGNVSPASGEVQCTAADPPDATQPVISLQQPTAGDVFTTTAPQLTFTGLAEDAGGNLSRAHVANTTKGDEDWDYSLSGPADEFRVPEIAVGYGDNEIAVTVYDAAGNSSSRSLQVRRLGASPGAVLIVAGHNETYAAQTNIYSAANRAVRIFRSAGFRDDPASPASNTIYYLAPVTTLDADGDGQADVDGPATKDRLAAAFSEWAPQHVGPEQPLFIYLIDHGLVEKTTEAEVFCLNGCAGGRLTPSELDGWLRTLEQDTGLDEVVIVVEACQSGSFIDRVNDPASSLSKENGERIVITSTDRQHFAYASAQGAFFSDAFFSCLADSGSLKRCFDEGRAAAQINQSSQAPWLDDNGDAVWDTGDGEIAQERFVTRFFSSVRPQIVSTAVERAESSHDGTLSAVVHAGAEAIDLVWAAVYPPSFTEPDEPTLNLSVPMVRLEADEEETGVYTFHYLNGFTEEGDYRVIFYAQDRLGIHAVPRAAGEGGPVYLPLIIAQ